MCLRHFTLQLMRAKVRAARAPQTKRLCETFALSKRVAFWREAADRSLMPWLNKHSFFLFLMITKYDSHSFVLRKQAYRMDADVGEQLGGKRWFACAHTLRSEWDHRSAASLSFSSSPSLPCEQTADIRRCSHRHTHIPAHTCATLCCFDWIKKGESFLRTRAHRSTCASRHHLPFQSGWCKPSSHPLVFYWRSFSPFCSSKKLIKRFEIWFRDVIRLPIELKMLRVIIFFSLKTKAQQLRNGPSLQKKEMKKRREQ